MCYRGIGSTRSAFGACEEAPAAVRLGLGLVLGLGLGRPREEVPAVVRRHASWVIPGLGLGLEIGLEIGLGLEEGL